jgi:hypothetical protein
MNERMDVYALTSMPLVYCRFCVLFQSAFGGSFSRIGAKGFLNGYCGTGERQYWAVLGGSLGVEPAT